MVREVVLKQDLPRVFVGDITSPQFIYVAIRKDGSGLESVYKLDSICDVDDKGHAFYRYSWFSVGSSYHKKPSDRYDTAASAISDVLSSGEYRVVEFGSFMEMLKWEGWDLRWE